MLKNCNRWDTGVVAHLGPFWILHVLLVSHPANRLVKQEKIDGYIFNMYSLSVL